MSAMPNGGRIGVVNIPAYPLSSISGIWTPEDAAISPWPNISAVSDVTYSNVAAHLHMEGIPGQAGAFNSSGHGSQFSTSGTAVAHPVLSTTQAKFGRTSMFFSGVSYLYSPSNAAYNLSTGDFTVRCWIYPTVMNAASGIFNIGGFQPEIYFDSTGVLIWYFGGNRITSSAGTIVANSWQFVEATRVSGNSRLFVGGTQVGSTYVDANNYAQNTINVGGTDLYTGYIDEFQLVVGQGVHTTNYSAPTTPFADY